VDVEKTIEFILDQQAKAEIRWQKADERMERFDQRMERLELQMERFDQRMERLEKRQEKFDKSLEGVRKLVVAGMKMINQLAAAQKRTDQRFDRLIELLRRRSPNGHR